MINFFLLKNKSKVFIESISYKMDSLLYNGVQIYKRLADYNIYNNNLTASELSIIGSIAIGNRLTGSYTFNGGTEGNTTYRWLYSTVLGGIKTPIIGATGINIVITSDVIDKYLYFEVMPISDIGEIGITSQSSPLLLTLDLPLTKSGLWCWLDVEDVITNTDGTNLYINRFNDKSGNLRHQIFAPSNATNASMAILGTDNSKVSALTDTNHFGSYIPSLGNGKLLLSEMTLFLDYHPSTIEDGRRILHASSNPTLFLKQISTSSGQLTMQIYDGVFTNIYIPFTANEHNIVTIRFKAGSNNLTYYKGTTLVGTGTISNALPIKLFSSISYLGVGGNDAGSKSTSYYGASGRLLIYNKWLSDADILELQNWMKNKSGL